MIELANQIRAEQNALPRPDRIDIGGELLLVSLQSGQIASTKIHQYEDFESVWQQMNEALASD
jgi:hypothetical protein